MNIDYKKKYIKYKSKYLKLIKYNQKGSSEIDELQKEIKDLEEKKEKFIEDNGGRTIVSKDKFLFDLLIDFNKAIKNKNDLLKEKLKPSSAPTPAPVPAPIPSSTPGPTPSPSPRSFGFGSESPSGTWRNSRPYGSTPSGFGSKSYGSKSTPSSDGDWRYKAPAPSKKSCDEDTDSIEELFKEECYGDKEEVKLRVNNKIKNKSELTRIIYGEAMRIINRDSNSVLNTSDVNRVLSEYLRNKRNSPRLLPTKDWNTISTIKDLKEHPGYAKYF